MTEIVFALGLGDRLVGVSGPFDDYPAEAKDIEEVGGAGDFGVDPNDREGRLARARSVPDDPRRRPVEAAPARPRHPGRHPRTRDTLRRSARRHRDGRRAHGRIGRGGRQLATEMRAEADETAIAVERGDDGARDVLLRGLLPAAHHGRPGHVHLRPAGAGRLRPGDRRRRSPTTRSGRSRISWPTSPGGLPRDAGVREERRGRREAARVRRDLRDRGRPGGAGRRRPGDARRGRG